MDGDRHPIQSTNSWFVEPGRSNWSCQEGTSKLLTSTQDILLGIAMPQTNAPAISMSDWKGRQTPPHIVSHGQPRKSNTTAKSRTLSGAEDNIHSQHKDHHQHRSRNMDSGPPDDGDNDDTIHSNKYGSFSHNQHRSCTPRPRRCRSSTLCPRRHHDSDDGRGGSSDDSSSDSYSTSSLSQSHLSYSSMSTSAVHHRKRQEVNDDIIIPCGTTPPMIKSKLKQEDLPSWDSNLKTTIAYFWRVQECATLGGYIPQALGYWLWLKLEEGSDVQSWLSTLPSHEQAKMRGHWVDYLKGIKEGYLGRNWQFNIGEKYKTQAFWEPGHKNRLPKVFITHHIMYTRMVVRSDNGGLLKVHLVMARAPLAWHMVLFLENIKSTSLLYMKAMEHQEALLNILRYKPSTMITMENLVVTLRRMGYVLQKPNLHHSFPPNKRANLMLGKLETPPDSSSAELKESYISVTETVASIWDPILPLYLLLSIT